MGLRVTTSPCIEKTSSREPNADLISLLTSWSTFHTKAVIGTGSHRRLRHPIGQSIVRLQVHLATSAKNIFPKSSVLQQSGSQGFSTVDFHESE